MRRPASMPAKYDREDDWARKLKMRSTGMFSTPSYWGVGEPFEDGRSGAPFPVPRVASVCVH